MKINVAVFFGCVSVEHEVSVISGVQAMQNMDKEKYNPIPVYVTKSGETYTGEALFDISKYKDIPEMLKECLPAVFFRKNDKVIMQTPAFLKPKETVIDLAFPIVHGTNCEDGTMAGFFEFLGLPYISCGVLAAALGMDKAVCKTVLEKADVPVLPCITLRQKDYLLNREKTEAIISDKIGYPLIVKPVNLGSSVGISKVHNKEELHSALELAFRFADELLCEHAISELKEVNCSVLGDKDHCRASVCEAPVMKDEILSYEDKYVSGGKGAKSSGSKGMASLSRKIPADITDEQTATIQKLAVDAFKALGCSGVVRIDFMIDLADGSIWLNEINTIPGSLAFYLWEAGGTSYTELIDELVAVAYRRKREKDELMFTFNNNLLSGGSAFGTKGGKL